MEKERINIKESTHALTTKFDILVKIGVSDFQTGSSGFTVVRWSIFPNGDQFYIFHNLDHTCMFFRLCTCFSDNLVQFHSRNKEVLQAIRL
jgi:hypothetical protein